MSNSPQSKTSEAGKNKTNSKVEFKTSNIGKWAAQQESPFAKQNRERQAKKQAQNKKRQKVAPYVVAVCGLVAVGLGIWGLVMLIGALTYSPINEDLNLGGNGAVEIQEGAQKLFNQHLQGNKDPEDGSSGSSTGDGAGGTSGTPSAEDEQQAVAAVQDYFQNWQNSTSDEKKKAQLQLLEVEFYYNNQQFNTVLSLTDSINYNALTQYELEQLYGMLMNVAYSVEDLNLGNYYLELLLQLNGDNNDTVEVEG